MAITYPVTPPSTVPQSITIRPRSTTGVSVSPFTAQHQVYSYPAQIWQMDVKLPPMKRAEAEPWIAFLLSLNGRRGTFTMGDVMGSTPRGTAIGPGVVDGGSQTGLTLSTTGWTGTELVSNGHFTTDTTGWTSADSSLSIVGGKLFIEQTGAYGNARQTVATVSGETYSYSFTVTPGTTGAYAFRQNGVAIDTGTAASETTYTGTFVALADDVQLAIVCNTATSTDDIYYDNVSVYEAQPNLLLAGDYIQVGSNLYRVTQDAAASGYPNDVDLEIWPTLRVSPANGTSITTVNTTGLWRLASDEMPYTPGNPWYDIQFSCVEAL